MSTNKQKCSWCNKNCYNGHYDSPDYRIKFCSNKCKSEYYDRYGVPAEKKNVFGCMFSLIFLFAIGFVIYTIFNNSGQNTTPLEPAPPTEIVDTLIVDSLDSTLDSTVTTEEEQPAETNSYSCRQCGAPIQWLGSYFWGSEINEYGEVRSDVQYLGDSSLEGDERINTEFYSDAGFITRGIFCSESCARINLENWTYPEEYKQKILSNQ